MASILECVNDRVSIRSYRDEKITDGDVAKLKTFIEGITEGPFGSPVRFAFLDERGLGKKEARQFGTYGMISGDKYYVAGAVKKGPYAELDYGYCLERIVLFATELGLGTCWLGGTMNRTAFADKLRLRDGEVIPAITPVGYPADRKRLKIMLIESVLQVRKRKEFDSIFFDGSIDRSLSKEAAAEWAVPLEAVRAAPSASNKQPWRAVKTADGFDFYADLDPSYDSGSRGFAVQKVDLGIACCHFDLVARELKLKGGWNVKSPAPVAGTLTYVASWVIG